MTSRRGGRAAAGCGSNGAAERPGVVAVVRGVDGAAAAAVSASRPRSLFRAGGCRVVDRRRLRRKERRERRRQRPLRLRLRPCLSFPMLPPRRQLFPPRPRLLSARKQLRSHAADVAADAPATARTVAAVAVAVAVPSPLLPPPSALVLGSARRPRFFPVAGGGGTLPPPPPADAACDTNPGICSRVFPPGRGGRVRQRRAGQRGRRHPRGHRLQGRRRDGESGRAGGAGGGRSGRVAVARRRDGVCLDRQKVGLLQHLQLLALISRVRWGGSAAESGSLWLPACLPA